MDTKTRKRFLTKQDIAASNDEEYAEIETWDGTFIAGSLTADDFIEWQEANEGPAKRNAGLRLIVKSHCAPLDGCPACAGEGEKHLGKHLRIGDDRDIEMYKAKSVAATEKVVAAIVKLNGLKIKGNDVKNG